MKAWLALALFLATSALAQGQQQPVRAVYHFSEGREQASRGLEYLRNHLETDPSAQIVVVGHAAGVDFLMKGAKPPRATSSALTRLQRREGYAYLKP